MTNASIAAPTQRTVSVGLALGVILVPIFFAWFLLKPGYSSRARFLAFGWLALVFLMLPRILSEGRLPENKVTLAEFVSIKNGMTYGEVVAVIGEPGELRSSTDILGLQIETYDWKNPDGSAIDASFQNGHMASKEQYDLK